jgi:3'-5' exoribonuclease
VSIVTVKDIASKGDKELFTTLALVQRYEVKPTKKGGKYIEGVLELQGSVPFKVWSGATFDEMDKCEYADTICEIDAEVNVYNGSKGLIIKRIIAVDNPEIKKEDFLKVKYDTNKYFNGFLTLLQSNCTPESLGVVEVIFSEDVLERFKVEFAASRHHDATKSGLLVHTYKVMYFMSKIIPMYQHTLDKCTKDLLMIGCALHDIGKIYEYTNGAVINSGTLVSHHTFAVEILHSKKESIIKAKSEDFYYRLLAIVEQHHGEYAERPRTIESYLIHLIDNLEASFQSVEESLEMGNTMVSSGGFKLV